MNESDEIENNTGIEFPGESLEAILNLPTNIGDDNLEDSELVVELS